MFGRESHTWSCSDRFSSPIPWLKEPPSAFFAFISDKSMYLGIRLNLDGRRISLDYYEEILSRRCAKKFSFTPLASRPFSSESAAKTPPFRAFRGVGKDSRGVSRRDHVSYRRDRTSHSGAPPITNRQATRRHGARSDCASDGPGGLVP